MFLIVLIGLILICGWKDALEIAVFGFFLALLALLVMVAASQLADADTTVIVCDPHCWVVTATATPTAVPTPGPTESPVVTASPTPTATATAVASCLAIATPPSGTLSGTVAVQTADTCPAVWYERLFVDGKQDSDWAVGGVSLNTANYANGTHSFYITAQKQNPCGPSGTGDDPSCTLGQSLTFSANFSNVAPTATPAPIPTAVPAVSTFPLSDAAATGQVNYSSWEPRPQNNAPNHNVPTTAQLQQVSNLSWYNSDGNRLIHLATGNFTGTTDEIIQWGAAKWGFDPDLVRAIAVVESSWRQDTLGDIGNGVSLGLLQIKSTSWPGTCPNGWNASTQTDPALTSPNCLSHNYTAFAVDYKLAVQRACVTGDGPDWFARAVITSGKARYVMGPGASNDVMGCAGAWFSGGWQDSGSITYQGWVRNALNNQTWLRAGF